MKTIAVDIDEVLARHNRALAQFHNQRYGTEHSEHDYFSDDWSKVWNVPLEEAKRRAVEFHKTNAHARLEVVDNATEVLTFLKQRFNLEIVTVRRQMTITSTHDWISKHFPGIFSNVHFIHFWDQSDNRTKADVCEQINADWLIDDGLKHVTQIAGRGRKGLLFGDYAWNQSGKLPNGVLRLNTWQDVGVYFNEQ